MRVIVLSLMLAMLLPCARAFAGGPCCERAAYDCCRQITRACKVLKCTPPVVTRCHLCPVTCYPEGCPPCLREVCHKPAVTCYPCCDDGYVPAVCHKPAVTLYPVDCCECECESECDCDRG